MHVVYGTRAELIKLSSVIKELQKRKIDFELVDLGQHDTTELRKSLGLPKPHYYFGQSYRKQWSKLESRIATYPAAVFIALAWGAKNFYKLASILSKSDLVIIHGNTMGVLLTVYATKFNISRAVNGKPKIVHIESGLRANAKTSLLLDWFYKIADENSDFLITTSKTAHNNLRQKGLHRKAKYVGNVLHEIVAQNLKKKPRMKIKDKDYVLINTSRSIITKSNAEEFLKVLTKSQIKFYFVVSPVIKHRLKIFGLLKKIQAARNVKILEQLNYIDFLHAIKNAMSVITDSEGVQEECAIMKKPCIVTNDFIQMSELVDGGIVKVTGCDALKIMHELELIRNKKGLYKTAKSSKLEIGDGKSTQRIVDFLERNI